jgi:hypothetical protein
MNPKRRKFVQNTAVLVAGLLLGKHVCANSRLLPNYCSLENGFTLKDIELLTSSGDTDLDRSMSLELSHISDSFTVLPGFGFYDEGDSRHANAFAINQTIIPNTEGTVVFGKHLLSAELTKHSWGGIAVAGIMAHEFAHIYQYQTSFYQLLTQSQQTHKLLELHADYLAGYYLGLKRLRSGEIDIKAFLDSLYLRGDMDFNSPTHHGTPMQRKQVMLDGYKIGLTNNIDIYQVAAMGMELVENI